MIELAGGIVLAFIILFLVPVVALPLVLAAIAASVYGLLSGIFAFVVSLILIAAFWR